MFSLMNRLKTDLRNRMKNGRLNDLMTVNRLAPSTLSDEELDELIDFWEADWQDWALHLLLQMRSFITKHALLLLLLHGAKQEDSQGGGEAEARS